MSKDFPRRSSRWRAGIRVCWPCISQFCDIKPNSVLYVVHTGLSMFVSKLQGKQRTKLLRVEWRKSLNQQKFSQTLSWITLSHPKEGLRLGGNVKFSAVYLYQSKNNLFRCYLILSILNEVKDTRTLIRLIYIVSTPSGKGIDETSISDKFITIYRQAENWTTFWVDFVLH